MAAYHKVVNNQIGKLEKETDLLGVRGEAFTLCVLEYYQDKAKDKFK